MVSAAICSVLQAKLDKQNKLLKFYNKSSKVKGRLTKSNNSYINSLRADVNFYHSQSKNTSKQNDFLNTLLDLLMPFQNHKSVANFIEDIKGFIVDNNNINDQLANTIDEKTIFFDDEKETINESNNSLNLDKIKLTQFINKSKKKIQKLQDKLNNCL